MKYVAGKSVESAKGQRKRLKSYKLFGLFLTHLLMCSYIFFDCVKAFSADHVLHLAGIICSNFFWDTEFDQPF